MRFRELRARRGDGEGDGDEVDLDYDEQDGDGVWGRHIRGKEKGKKRKDVWVGGSFDIGREFRGEQVRQVDDAESGKDAVRDGEGEVSMPPASPVDGTNASAGPSRAASAPPNVDLTKTSRNEGPAGMSEGEGDRPAPSRATTQDTFVTARTRFSDAQSQASGSTSRLDLSSHPPAGDGHDYELSGMRDQSQTPIGPSPSDGLMHLSPAMAPSTSRHSGTSSMHPLISLPETPISESPDSTLSPTDPGPGPSSSKAKKYTSTPTSPRSISAIRGRLKSALRRASAPPHASLGDDEAMDLGTDGTGPTGSPRAPAAKRAQEQGRAKTVQFPVDLNDAPGVMRRQIRKGNKAPADPGDVLAREGEEAEGTSAGAVEDALHDEEEEGFEPGSVMLRGR